MMQVAGTSEGLYIRDRPPLNESFGCARRLRDGYINTFVQIFNTNNAFFGMFRQIGKMKY
jgi:hypothetical protein